MNITTLNKFRKKEKSEADWIYNIRKNGWNSFIKSPLPDRVKHLWKYTDPKNFLYEIDSSYMAVNITDSKTDTGESIREEYSGYGFNTRDLSTSALIDKQSAEAGVIFCDLQSALTTHQDLVGNHLGQLIDNKFGKFEAANIALWNTGLFLYIPDHVELEKPIRLLRTPSDRATYHRLLVIAGKNSKATVVDEYADDDRDAKFQINSVVELYAETGSNLKYANLQRLNKNSTVYITQRAKIERDSSLMAIFGALGGQLSKVNAGTILNGKGSESRIRGIVFGDDNQNFDFHTRHHHKSGESYSDIDFKVALKDKSNSAYTGLIKIEEDALNCQAFQENRNLLLNSGPKAESIPELEILCDQVQCSHGATMGPIDPEMIFYLQSRGLSYENAVRTVVTGFVEPTLSQLPDELKDLMRQLTLEKLEGK